MAAMAKMPPIMKSGNCTIIFIVATLSFPQNYFRGAMAPVAPCSYTKLTIQLPLELPRIDFLSEAVVLIKDNDINIHKTFSTKWGDQSPISC